MDLKIALDHRAQVEQFRHKYRTGLVTLLFTDMVGSTKLKQALGDRDAVALMHHHHAVVREILSQFPDGQEISTAGDSFFLVFIKPSDAVRFALLLQARLRGLNKDSSHPVWDRIGIHIGEVVIEEREGAAKPRDLYGMQVDSCARVMSLGAGNQILLTRSAFDNARQALKGEEMAGLGALSWLNHGTYQLAGVEEPVEICEVGEANLGALKQPGDSEKARRAVVGDQETVLGWRPAAGQLVPNTKWVLEQKLGEGGFGEVWLGRHQTMKERRVFKFCFRADRVRSLKREMTLFRILKERVGDHPNIVRLLEVYFDEPPFYVVMDHVEGHDLTDWCEEQGGVENVPLAARLEIVAQIADALQAAHDAGVIHRDVKPGNILIHRSSRGNEALTSRIANRQSPIENQSEPPHQPSSDYGPAGVGCYDLEVKLTDFGIGQVVSAEAMAGVTNAGFTQTIVAESSSSQTGSQMYMAPELLAGKSASTRSDIYSLGVVLYQLLVGDFSRPLTTDWVKDISDPLLKEDLQQCFAGNPQDRFAGAGQLAKNLRALPERQEALVKQQTELAARERKAYRMGVMRTAAGALLVVALVSLLAVYSWRTAQKQRLNAYVADMNVANLALQDHQVARAKELVEQYLQRKPWEADLRGFEWRLLWQRCQPDDHATVAEYPDWATCAVFSPDGTLLATGGYDKKAEVIDVQSKQIVKSFAGLEGDIDTRGIAFSPDGKLLAIKAGGRVRVWRTENWVEACPPLPAESNSLLHPGSNYNDALVFSPDGATLATRVPGGVGFWDTVNWRGPTLLPARESLGTVLAYSADGKFLALSDLNNLYISDALSAGRTLVTNLVPQLVPQVTGRGGRVLSVAFSRELMAAGYRDGVVKLWSIGTWAEQATVKVHDSFVLGLNFSPDGKTLVTGGTGHVLKLWDVALLQQKILANQVIQPITTLKGHARIIHSVLFSSDGRSIASSSSDGTVRLWSGLARLEGQTLSGSRRPVWFSPDGTQLIVQDRDDRLRRWKVAERQDLGQISGVDSLTNYTPFAISTDGQALALGQQDGNIQIRDLKTGQPLKTLLGDGSHVRRVEFSPSKELLAAESEAALSLSIRVWQIATGKSMHVLRKTRGKFAFSPDSRMLAVGRSDDSLELVDLASGASHPLSGHPLGVEGMAFSPDGQWLAVSGSGDETIWLGEIRSRRLVPTFKRPQEGVHLLAFSPDGKTLVNCSSDNIITFWNIALRKEVMSMPNFAPAKWSLLFSQTGNALAVNAAQSPVARGEVELWTVPTLAEIDAEEKRKAPSK